MADLTGKTLANGYPNLVTIGATTNDDPTTGTLENGKGNNLTSVTFDGAVVVNESGGNNDFRVEGDTETNLIFADASADSVGIGTSSPDRNLHVIGTAAIETTTGNGSFLFIPTGTDNRLYSRAGNTTTTALPLSFIMGGSEKLRILASGGITFNGDTAAANALDDYEEGTWTPTLEGDTTAGTYTFSTNQSLYTKIGRQVTATSRLVVGTASGGVGLAKFGGLPFTKVINSILVGSVTLNGVDVDNSTISLSVNGYTSLGPTTEFLIVSTLDNANFDILDIAGISSGDTIQMSFTYFV